MLDVFDSHIYIADDEAANRDLLEAILARAGFGACRSFEDGGPLLGAIATEEPDLVLLDLHMPGTGGMAVLETLRGGGTDVDAAHLPVLVLTADATRESRRAALAGGATDFLTKPFDTAEVVLRVRNLLETRRLHRELRSRNAALSGEVAIASRALAEREQEWVLHAAALSHLRELATPEETAQSICDEISRLPGFGMSLIVALDAIGHAVPLGRDESVDIRVAVNQPLPPRVVENWRERLSSGPWVGPWINDFGSFLQRSPGDGPTAMAIVPLQRGSDRLGALVVGSTVQEGIPHLSARLPLLESFAAVASALLAEPVLARQRFGSIRAGTELLLERGAFIPVFQPVRELATGRQVGSEALTRFTDGTRPDRVFADAGAVGLGLELEIAAIRAAVRSAGDRTGDGWLSLNASPSLVTEGNRLRDAVGDAARPVVVEVTEHVAIEDYATLRRAASEIPGVRYAVDDAGAGFASFRHILELRPDFVKLDAALIRDIDGDAVRQALVAGIVYFAGKIGCQLIAEGIETDAELLQLVALGVPLGQGYLLGRPEPVAA
jgi:EAL domain-containing protein (putative c-di-GMP-specific phosphodiesterase class I)/DNA-binding response OmpR family regulator